MLQGIRRRSWRHPRQHTHSRQHSRRMARRVSACPPCHSPPHTTGGGLSRYGWVGGAARRTPRIRCTRTRSTPCFLFLLPSLLRHRTAKSTGHQSRSFSRSLALTLFASLSLSFPLALLLSCSLALLLSCSLLSRAALSSSRCCAPVQQSPLVERSLSLSFLAFLCLSPSLLPSLPSPFLPLFSLPPPSLSLSLACRY
jgi:hypothetical protein